MEAHSKTGNAGAVHKFALSRVPPDGEIVATRIETLTTLITFLNAHLFPHLPSHLDFPLSLCKPLTSALLDHLLIPLLPSSMDHLPQFLTLVQQALDFDRRYIGRLLGDKSPERKIKSWADAVDTHYERRRRGDLLERARGIVLRKTNEKEVFTVEVALVEELEDDHLPATEPVPSQPPPVAEEVAWDFEEGDNVDTDGWGFGDEPDPDAETAPESPTIAPEPQSKPKDKEPELAEGDPDDPWGWNDDSAPTGDGDASTDSSAWDDPWGDPDTATEETHAKPATKLEKFSTGKGSSTTAASSLQSPPLVGAPSPIPAIPPPSAQQSLSKAPARTVVKESYVVSSRMKELVALVQDILGEASDLASSGILSSFQSGSSPVGNVIRQAAALSLDLYRALYPVAFAAQLGASPKQSCGFSNDCLWMGKEVAALTAGTDRIVDANKKLEESADRLKVLGESWFEDIIVSRSLSARGFDSESMLSSRTVGVNRSTSSWMALKVLSERTNKTVLTNAKKL